MSGPVMTKANGGFVPCGWDKGRCPGCLKENDYPAYLGRAVWHGGCWDEHLAKLGGYNPEGEIYE